MTPDEMRDAIEAVYRESLNAHGASFVDEVPDGITPQSWHVGIAPGAADKTAAEFAERYGDPAGQALASLGLHYGLDTFSHLCLQDRPQVQVGKRKRERQIVVHAFGWNSTQPDSWKHEPRWPHLIKGESK